MKKSPLNYLILLLSIWMNGTLLLNAQNILSFRNNTGLDLEIKVSLTGPAVPDSSLWDNTVSLQKAWDEDTELLRMSDDPAAVAEGDTAGFRVNVIAGTDTFSMDIRFEGDTLGPLVSFRAEGPGLSHPWTNDAAFHTDTTTFGGKTVILKYKAEPADTDNSRSLLFVLHEDPVYTIDPADFADPNTINVMAYNIQMLPFGVSGMPQAALRADLMPAHFDELQDVIIFAEAFDDGPRNDHLIPAMTARGFTYRTDILNDYFPSNGGIMIFSRWPIETTAELDFELCGAAAADCLANKGILYARVNKLGKRYHIFGTHMDAGGGTDDYEARASQFAEMRDFIAAQGYQQNEPAIYGGDFNVGPLDTDWPGALDSLHPILPEAIGFHTSTGNPSLGNIIDHVWADRRFLVPLEATNEVITIRGIEDAMWELSDFSDHRTALGRFVYPEVVFTGTDTTICPGDSISWDATASIPVTQQWVKDGTPISGATGTNLTLNGVDFPDAGTYECNIQYEQIYGDSPDALNSLFYIYGVDTVEANLNLHISDLSVVIDCETNRGEIELPGLKLYPNPNRGVFRLETKGMNEEMQIEIRDLEGKRVYLRDKVLTAAEIRTDHLSEGVYILHIRTKSYQSILRMMVTQN